MHIFSMLMPLYEFTTISRMYVFFIVWKKRTAAKYFGYSYHLQFSRFFEGYYFTIKGYGTTAQLGMRLFRNSAATSAFGRPTSFGLEKK